MITYTPAMLDRDLERLESGETIKCNPAWHDAICEYLNPQDTDRAAQFFMNCRIAPNPNCYGTADTHLATYGNTFALVG